MGPFGSKITRDNFVDKGVPVIRGNNLRDGFNEDKFVYLKEEKATELSSANVFSYDIVFTHRGTLGQVGIIPEQALHPRYVVSQSQMYLRVDKSIISPYLVYHYFKSRHGTNVLLSFRSQTGVPALSRPTTSLKSIQIIVPHIKLSGAFDNLISPMKQKITLADREVDSLSQLRDILLPQLLSGELSISNLK